MKDKRIAKLVITVIVGAIAAIKGAAAIEMVKNMDKTEPKRTE